VNGANSVYSGAGSVGGNINLVSKAVRENDFTVIQAGAGTDSYGRITVDSNTSLDNGVAFRINAMAHQNDAPGRDYEDFKRWGIAPSIAFGLGTDTRFTLSYFHQSDDNFPQYGVPTSAPSAARCLVWTRATTTATTTSIRRRSTSTC
jgi:catecholate siderophore receptor